MVQEGLRERDVEEKVTVVSITSDDNPAEAVACAAVACAIAEGVAKDEGGDALVVIDDLAGHKALWEGTTKTLLDVYGEEAVVKEDVNGGASSEMSAFYSGTIDWCRVWSLDWRRKDRTVASHFVRMFVTLLR